MVDTPSLPSPENERFARQLDWNLLFVFFVVVEERNFTRAAARLNVTQPAISNGIKRLETQVGCPLIDRSLPGFALTQAGNELFDECRLMYTSVSGLETTLARADEDVHGVIRLAMLTHVDCAIFDQTVAEFYQKYPGVTFDFAISTSARVIDRVAKNAACAGICLMETIQPYMEAELLFRETFALFCGRSHRLAGRRGLSFADIRNDPFVSFPTDRSHGPLSAYSKMRSRHQLSDKMAGVSSNLEEVKRMIQIGLGIGPLPIHVVQPAANAGDIWQLDIPNSTQKSDIYLITNQRARPSRAETLFIEALRLKIKQTPIEARDYPITRERA